MGCGRKRPGGMRYLVFTGRMPGASHSAPLQPRRPRHPSQKNAEGRRHRTIGDEGVIFELEGAGAITRMWIVNRESIPLRFPMRFRCASWKLAASKALRFLKRQASPLARGHSGPGLSVIDPTLKAR